MTKSELKTGYIVEIGSGNKFMVFKDTFDKDDKLITGNCGFIFLYNYSEDLIFLTSDHSWDVIKIYESSNIQTAFGTISTGKYSEELSLIWDRKNENEKEKKLNKLIKDLEGQLNNAKQLLKEIVK